MRNTMPIINQIHLTFRTALEQPRFFQFFFFSLPSLMYTHTRTGISCLSQNEKKMKLNRKRHTYSSNEIHSRQIHFFSGHLIGSLESTK